MATDGGAPISSAGVTRKVVCKFPPDPDGKYAEMRIRDLLAKGVISFKDPGTQNPLRSIPYNETTFSYAPAGSQDMATHPFNDVLPPPALKDFKDHIERIVIFDLADGHFDASITGSAFRSYATGQENNEESDWTEETTDHWGGWLLRIAAAYQTFCREEAVPPPQSASPQTQPKLVEIIMDPPPPPPAEPSHYIPPPKLSFLDRYADFYGRFETPLLLAAAAFFVGGITGFIILRRMPRFDLIASKLVQGKKVPGGAGRLERKVLFTLTAGEARLWRRQIPAIHYNRGWLRGTLHLEEVHIEPTIRHLEERYGSLVETRRFAEADVVEAQLRKLSGFISEGKVPARPRVASGQHVAGVRPLAEPPVVPVEGSSPGAVRQHYGMRIVQGKDGRLQIVPLDKAVVLEHLQRQVEVTGLSKVIRRPDGRVEVVALDKTVLAPVPGPAPSAGFPPPQVVSEPSLLTRMGTSVYADQDRIAFVEFLGRTRRMDAAQYQNFLVYSKKRVTRRLQNGTYQLDVEDANPLYVEMCAVAKGWHGSAVGYVDIPILPGGRVALSDDQRGLLAQHLGRNLTGDSFLVTLSEEGPNNLTMSDISRATRSLAEFIGRTQDEIRYRALALLEAIYEAPYPLV